MTRLYRHVVFCSFVLWRKFTLNHPYIYRCKNESIYISLLNVPGRNFHILIFIPVSFLLSWSWDHNSRLDVSHVVRCVSIVDHEDAFSCIHVLVSLQTSLLMSQQVVFEDTKLLSFTIDLDNDTLLLYKHCCEVLLTRSLRSSSGHQQLCMLLRHFC